MIHLLDDALESWVQHELRSSVGGRDVSVSFDTPDRDFDGSSPGPTVNLFLWDIMQSARSSSGRVVERAEGAGAVHRGPDPFMEFRYLVSAWGPSVRDQHRILGELTRAVMRNRMIAERHLPDALRTVAPSPELVLGSSGGRTLADLWSAFDGQLRPGLDLVVVARVDAHPERGAGEDVTVYSLDAGEPVAGPVSAATTPADANRDVEIRLIERRGPGTSSRTMAALRCDPAMAGVRITSRRSASTISKDGTCIVSAEPGATITVHAAEPFEVTVPED